MNWFVAHTKSMYLPVDLHEILTEAASVVAIAVWLRFPLGEVAIQFDGRNGQRNWIQDCCSLCLLDLLDFFVFGHMNMFGFALTPEKLLWFDRARLDLWGTECGYWGGVWSAEYVYCLRDLLRPSDLHLLSCGSIHWHTKVIELNEVQTTCLWIEGIGIGRIDSSTIWPCCRDCKRTGCLCSELP